ncbi:MAG: hypothetical protein IJY53_05385 [Akkermansia sp.]|nr:hypothetical protein [Akkermansia sp.]
MKNKSELKSLLCMLIIYTAIFFLPLNHQAFRTSILATLDLAKWYAQEHVILCLLPAFFIVGIIAVFISKDSVLKYLGAACSGRIRIAGL